MNKSLKILLENNNYDIILKLLKNNNFIYIDNECLSLLLKKKQENPNDLVQLIYNFICTKYRELIISYYPNDGHQFLKPINEISTIIELYYFNNKINNNFIDENNNSINDLNITKRNKSYKSLQLIDYLLLNNKIDSLKYIVDNIQTNTLKEIIEFNKINEIEFKTTIECFHKFLNPLTNEKMEFIQYLQLDLQSTILQYDKDLLVINCIFNEKILSVMFSILLNPKYYEFKISLAKYHLTNINHAKLYVLKQIQSIEPWNERVKEKQRLFRIFLFENNSRIETLEVLINVALDKLIEKESKCQEELFHYFGDYLLYYFLSKNNYSIKTIIYQKKEYHFKIENHRPWLIFLYSLYKLSTPALKLYIQYQKSIIPDQNLLKQPHPKIDFLNDLYENRFKEIQYYEDCIDKSKETKFFENLMEYSNCFKHDEFWLELYKSVLTYYGSDYFDWIVESNEKFKLFFIQFCSKHFIKILNLFLTIKDKSNEIDITPIGLLFKNLKTFKESSMINNYGILITSEYLEKDKVKLNELAIITSEILNQLNSNNLLYEVIIHIFETVKYMTINLTIEFFTLLNQEMVSKITNNNSIEQFYLYKSNFLIHGLIKSIKNNDLISIKKIIIILNNNSGLKNSHLNEIKNLNCYSEILNWLFVNNYLGLLDFKLLVYEIHKIMKLEYDDIFKILSKDSNDFDQLKNQYFNLNNNCNNKLYHIYSLNNSTDKKNLYPSFENDNERKTNGSSENKENEYFDYYEDDESSNQDNEQYESEEENIEENHIDDKAPDYIEKNKKSMEKDMINTINNNNYYDSGFEFEDFENIRNDGDLEDFEDFSDYENLEGENNESYDQDEIMEEVREEIRDISIQEETYEEYKENETVIKTINNMYIDENENENRIYTFYEILEMFEKGNFEKIICYFQRNGNQYEELTSRNYIQLIIKSIQKYSISLKFFEKLYSLLFISSLSFNDVVSLSYFNIEIFEFMWVYHLNEDSEKIKLLKQLIYKEMKDPKYHLIIEYIIREKREIVNEIIYEKEQIIELLDLSLKNCAIPIFKLILSLLPNYKYKISPSLIIDILIINGDYKSSFILEYLYENKYLDNINSIGITSLPKTSFSTYNKSVYILIQNILKNQNQNNS